MKWLITILILFQLKPTPAADRNAAQAIKEANRLYKTGHWAAAATAYDRAINGTYANIAWFNKGNALFRQKKYGEAVKAYRQAASTSEQDKHFLSAAAYNTGVVYSNEKKIEESIEAYKNALRLNWHDTKARENLQKALMEQQQRSGGGGGNDQNPAQQPSKSNLSQSQVQQQLDRLEEKEKASQQKISGKKGQYGGSAGKDW